MPKQKLLDVELKHKQGDVNFMTCQMLVISPLTRDLLISIEGWPSATLAIYSLVEVQVSHVFWWINWSPDFAVIKYHPSSIFMHMGHIMPTVGRGPNVAN